MCCVTVSCVGCVNGVLCYWELCDCMSCVGCVLCYFELCVMCNLCVVLLSVV